MLALDIIRHAVPVLAPYERHLLPTAHLIWFGVVSLEEEQKKRSASFLIL